MSITESVTKEEESGLQMTLLPVRELISQLPPWMLAPLQLPPSESERQVISVAEASDAHFQEWIVAHNVPVDDAGIPDWSFDDRLDVICYALENGLRLTFVDEQNKLYRMVKINSVEQVQSTPKELENNSETELIDELFEASEPKPERSLPTGMPDTSGTPATRAINFGIGLWNAAMTDNENRLKKEANQAMQNTQECERCGDETVLTKVETVVGIEPHQEAMLCEDCVHVVQLPNAAWKVGNSEEA